MARPATGQVVEKVGARGRSFALRFRAYGKREYVTLGKDTDGWTRAQAAQELANVLADVRRGVWRPLPAEVTPDVKPDPTFHEFASEWLAARRGELRPNTLLDYERQLTHHLLPFFAGHRLSQITIAEVDRYRHAQVREADRRRRALAAWQKRCEALPEGAPRPRQEGHARHLRARHAAWSGGEGGSARSRRRRNSRRGEHRPGNAAAPGRAVDAMTLGVRP